MRTVAIINQKGGSGKTTTAINLSSALARRSQRTLLVDMDPQSHCALGVAIPENQIELQVGDVLTARPGRPLDRSRLMWQISRDLELIPSTTKLAGVEAARGGLADREDRDTCLGNYLKTLEENYDYCVIDCPPSIGLLTFNALRAADEVLIPVETGYFALQGASKQVSTIRALCRRFGVRIPYRILPTMHDEQSVLARDILEQLRNRFPKQMLDVVIRLDLKLREAASLGLPVQEYDITSRGARDYDTLSQRYTDAALRPAYDDNEPVMPSLPLSASRIRGTAHQQSPLVGIQTSPMVTKAAPPMTRAAELAARARQLASRSVELNARLDRDEDLAAVNKTEPPKTLPHVQTELKRIPRVQRLYGAHSTSKGLLFAYPAGPQAAVFVAGDHNGWSTTATPLHYNPEMGLHETCIAVLPGTYKYRLIVNGQWLTDPHNPRAEPNPYGGRDSVAVVEALPQVDQPAATRGMEPHPTSIPHADTECSAWSPSES